MIVAGTRDQNTTPLAKRPTIPLLSLFVNSSTSTTWNSDVQILSASNPELRIDSSGNVVKQNGIKFNRFANDIFIQDIVPAGPGQVLFEGFILTGNTSTFTFDRTPSRIDISTGKGDLYLSNISTSNSAGSGIEPKVTIDLPINTLV